MNVNMRQFVRGALFLTIAGFTSKVLSAAYRIPLQNLTGDHGFYIYQQVYPFLGMMTVLALYGFPSAIAKILSEAKRRKVRLTFRTVYGPIFILLMIGMGILSILFFISADRLALLMGDIKLSTAYRWIAFALLWIPLISLLRGIFQGFGRMTVIAYSQVSEQLLRVFIIISASLFISYGVFDLYSLGVLGVLASVVGFLTALIVLLFHVRTLPLMVDGEEEGSWVEYARTLLLFGVLASFNHMILLFIQFADAFTLVPQLVKGGLGKMQAMEQKGVFDRGMPLIQLGTVVGSSFALALVPMVSKEEFERSKMTIERSVKIGLFLSFGAVLGLVFLFEETNVLLYKDTLGTNSLRILSLSILFGSLSIIMISILQSFGYFFQTAIIIFASFILKGVGNVLFVPSLGITGSAFSTVISLCFLWGVSSFLVKRYHREVSLCKLSWLRPLLIAGVGMVLFLLGVKTFLPYGIVDSRFGLLLYMFFIISSGAALYIFLLLRFGAFTKEEVSALPFANLLLHFHKGRD